MLVWSGPLQWHAEAALAAGHALCMTVCMVPARTQTVLQQWRSPSIAAVSRCRCCHGSAALFPAMEARALDRQPCACLADRPVLELSCPLDSTLEVGASCLLLSAAHGELVGGRGKSRTAARVCFSAGCESTRPSHSRSSVVAPSAQPTAAMAPVSCKRRLLMGQSATCRRHACYISWAFQGVSGQQHTPWLLFCVHVGCPEEQFYPLAEQLVGQMPNMW